jgi:NADPH-dependent curcumin reductase CurA
MQGEWSFVTPYQLNQVMDSIGLGVVMGSINSPFKKGDIVYGNNFPWQDEFVFDKDKAQKELKKLDKDMNLSHAMGVLGMTGATAYYGFFNIGQPKSGEVVCVTGAGGAVGLVVSQLAMIHGCKVVALAGEERKLNKLKQLGFQDVLDHRKGNLAQELHKLCPDGIDIFWDNVGGPIHDAVMKNLRIGARVVLCGAISQYNGEYQTGPRHNMTMIDKSVTMRGFITFRDFPDFSEAQEKLSQWMKEEKLQVDETIYSGLENVPQAFLDMMKGKNVGKMIVQIDTQEQAD